MANREAGYGFSAEIQAKLDSKYDIELEQQVRIWMESVTGEPLVQGMPQDVLLGPEMIHESLKDGVYLCQLMNVIVPGSCKPSKSKIAFKQMENISMFLTACEKYGVKKVDMFQTVDLFDNTNIGQVVQTIYALGRKCQSNNFEGPKLGPKESTPQTRQFNEEVLRRGESVIPMQMGSNKFQDTGADYGKRRQIIPDASSAK